MIKGQKQHNSDFQSHFSASSIGRILLNFFFIEKYKRGERLLLLTYSNNFDFSKRGTNFQPSILKGPKGHKYFMAIFVALWSYLLTVWTIKFQFHIKLVAFRIKSTYPILYSYSLSVMVKLMHSSSQF